MNSNSYSYKENKALTSLTSAYSKKFEKRSEDTKHEKIHNYKIFLDRIRALLKF